MKCYRCSTQCGPEPPDFTGGCPTDSFVDLDMCHLQCGGSPSPSPAPSPTPPPIPPSPDVVVAMRDQVLRAHAYYRKDAIYQANGQSPAQYAADIKWDDSLAKDAAAWAANLVQDCGNSSLFDKGPGQNVTKITGAPESLHYSWSDVVNNWLYEGCKGMPLPDQSPAVQSHLYGHYMTAALRDQDAVGCAAEFIPSCSATGKSLQVYVCNYGKEANPVTSETLASYPAHPMSAPLCSLSEPFPVNLV